MTYPKPWMSRTQKGIASIAVLIGLGFAIACGRGPQQPVPTQFGGYPMSEALNAIVQTHVEAATDREQRMVLTTWFQDGDPQGVSQFMSVTPAGKCATWQFVSSITEFRGRPTKQLSPETVATLQKTLTELPPTQKPTLPNMVIVSFRNNSGVWETRLYDRTNRPAALSTILEFTGAPIVP